MNLIAEIYTELERADIARVAGKEGQARVCARRAAGIAARDFLARNGAPALDTAQGSPHTSSAYTSLQTLAAFPGLAPHLKQAALHLTMRVNEGFRLPPGIDLIAEAHKLIGGLK